MRDQRFDGEDAKCSYSCEVPKALVPIASRQRPFARVQLVHEVLEDHFSFLRGRRNENFGIWLGNREDP